MNPSTEASDCSTATHHRDLTINYPLKWEPEYKEKGIVSLWLNTYPELFSIHVDPYGRLANPGSLALFAQYALMYLLRCEGIHSITWLEVGANYKRPVKNQLRLDTQFEIMRRWMGEETFDALREALSRTDLGSWKGEPDLSVGIRRHPNGSSLKQRGEEKAQTFAV